MDRRFSVAIAGSLILFLGVFTPIVQLPFVGGQNFFQNGKGDGVFILALAAISAVLAFTGRYRGLIGTGGIALALLAYTFLSFQSRIGQMRDQMNRDLADNPFRGLAEGMMQGVQLQWGWAVLVIGSLLVLGAGLMPAQPKESPAPNGG